LSRPRRCVSPNELNKYLFSPRPFYISLNFTASLAVLLLVIVVVVVAVVAVVATTEAVGAAVQLRFSGTKPVSLGAMKLMSYITIIQMRQFQKK
jgi:hypothetical protein